MRRYPEYRESGIEWAGMIPSHWKEARVKTHADLLNGFPFKSDYFNDLEGVPLVRIRDITAGFSDTRFSGDFDSRYLVSDEDILIGMDGDFLVRWWKGGEALLNQRCCCVRPLPTVSKRYLYYVLPHPLDVINDLTYFTTVKHLSSGDVLNISFPFPQLDEQLEIAAFLDRKTAQIDTLIQKKQALINLLREQRTALINRAVTKGLDPDVPMKDSAIDWLEEVPAHWEITKIKWLSPVSRGASPRPINHPKYFDENGEYAWVRIGDVTASERYLTSTTQTLSDAGADRSVKMAPGNLILSIAGSVGKPIITKIKCCIHDGFVYFPDLTINPEFLYYIFLSGEPYKGLGKWGTQLNLNTDTVGDIYIGLPPAEEIDRIVAYLDDSLSEIDALVEGEQTQVSLLAELRSSLISEVVTGKIDVRDSVAAESSERVLVA